MKTDSGTLLIVDDEAGICSAFKRYFEARGHEVAVAASADDGLRAFRRIHPDIVFIDVRLPDGSGLDLLRDIRRDCADVLAVLITAYTSLATVGEAMREGAFDYLVKPLDLDRAEEVVGQALATRAVRAPDGGSDGAADADPEEGLLVGRSRPMQEVCKAVARAAVSDASVLVTGATGTGKEMVARAIHMHSGRAGAPFVAVNCAALPEALMESELFGYAAGAFTGAVEDKPGRFEAADGGTLLLDEIGDLPLAVQVKLLRFLDQHKIERLGSLASVQLDVRVVAATHCDLETAVSDSRFREDLFYRLAVIQIHLPPLCERRDDVLRLARHFLRHLNAPRPMPVLAPEAAAALEAYTWPGNVRELRNAVEHALVASGGRTILRSHLPQTVRRGGRPAGPGDDDIQRCLEAYLDRVSDTPVNLHAAVLDPVECALIRRVMDETDGNQSAAAARLGIHRNTLREKLRAYGLSDPPA